MHPRPRLIVACLALALLPAPTASAARPAAPSPATLGIEYVVGQQVADGGFFRQAQHVTASGGLADTLVAVLSDAGASPGSVDRAVARLVADGPAVTSRAAYAGRAVMALAAAGLDPRDAGGYDYVARLASFWNPAGYWESQMYANALAALGVVAAGEPVPAQAILWVRTNQCADGGFGWFTVCLNGSDVDTTALVLNVLVAAGVPRTDAAVTRARDYLVAARNDDGGFGGKPRTFTNANSTGLVLSAIAALGERPTAAPWNAGGSDPLTAVLRLQTESGGFLWRAGDAGGIDNYATVQAVPGVAGQAYPIDPVRPDRCQKPHPDQSRRPCNR